MGEAATSGGKLEPAALCFCVKKGMAEPQSLTSLAASQEDLDVKLGIPCYLGQDWTRVK